MFLGGGPNSGPHALSTCLWTTKTLPLSLPFLQYLNQRVCVLALKELQ